MQIWYPADRKQGLQTAPYLPELAVLGSMLARFDAFKEGVDQLAEVTNNSLLRAGVARQHRTYPVIIFSHGTKQKVSKTEQAQ